MGLSRKTFFYSILLASVMIASVIGYFVFMLPSLYVNYVMESNLRSAVEIQKGYIRDGSYEHLTVRNPSATFSVEIPKEGRELAAAGKFFRLTVEVRDEELLVLLGRLQKILGGAKENPEEMKAFSREGLCRLWETELREKLVGEGLFPENYPLRISLESREDSGVYREDYFEVHMPEDGLVVYEAGVSDGSYGYTTYIVAGQTEDAFIFTVLPTMTPRMEEIRPVVTESLPMIAAVVFFLVLIASRFFSGRIVGPIIRLAKDVENVRLTASCEAEATVRQRQDEIGALGRALSELHVRLRDSYMELQEKNAALEEEGERREVFLRASSHQLKTPVTAALLLVDGMINKIGKYRDAEKFLPEVKRQLLSMRQLVDDILYLNYRADNMQIEPVAVETVAEEVLRAYEVQAENKKIKITLKGQKTVRADREMLKKIIDNLVSNAVAYTPEEERIEVEIGGDGLCIRNYGVVIDGKLLPNIFDPFVSSDTGSRGKGLGLYVAAYYGRLMGCTLQVTNLENGVSAALRIGLQGFG